MGANLCVSKNTEDNLKTKYHIILSTKCFYEVHAQLDQSLIVSIDLFYNIKEWYYTFKVP